MFPAFDRFFIPLVSSSRRFLQAQPRSFEQAAYVRWVVYDAELFSDHLGHPLARPHLTPKTVRLGTSGQQLGQPRPLLWSKSRNSSRCLPAAERLDATALFASTQPLADRSLSNPQCCGYLMLFPTLLVQFPSA